MTTQHKQDTTLALAALVDDLAQTKASIATLQERETQLKEALVQMNGAGVVESEIYRCTLALVPGREVTDWRAIAERFKPSRQLIVANTTTGNPFWSVHLYARKTS